MVLFVLAIGVIMIIGIAVMLMIYSGDVVESECTQDCDQGRKCTCRLTPEEIRRRFEDECG
jgi:hypothetical protein